MSTRGIYALGPAVCYRLCRIAWFTGLHRLGDFANACGQWDIAFSDGSIESRKSLAKTVLIFSAVRDYRAHVHLWVFAANEFFPDSMSASGLFGE